MSASGLENRIQSVAWHRRLSVRLFIALAAILGFAGLAAVNLMTKAASRHALEVQQKLSRDVAKAIVKHGSFFAGGEVDQEGMKSLFMKLMAVNPNLEVYLLDGEGKILAFDAPPERIIRESVDLKPVQRFLNGEQGLLFGQDPRSLDKDNIFTVWPVSENEQSRGFIYAILAGERQASLAAQLGQSHQLRQAVWMIFATTLLAMAMGSAAVFLITRRLGGLQRAVNAFRSGDQNARADTGGSDEVAALALDFNRMADAQVRQISKIRQADRTRREMITNISHDLRTPVASLRGYLETCLLKEGRLTADQRQQYLQAAFRNTERLAQLLEELFELARLDSGEIRLRPEVFSMSELISDVVQKFEPRADQEGIRLRASIPSENVLVQGDIGLLERVLDNLVENALRYSQSGNQVQVSILRKSQKIQIQVADNGPGISEEDLPRIFERFFRGDKSRRTAAGGTGLGLAIAKRILQMHKSPIGVKSRPGRGTVFAFRLPEA
ncbi:MAG: HAMP domain-containing protein [Planctomycetota bacterium]|nr:MAG: HAMP domain-containing protein [Planctomycetota bacterium]